MRVSPEQRRGNRTELGALAVSTALLAGCIYVVPDEGQYPTETPRPSTRPEAPPPAPRPPPPAEPLPPEPPPPPPVPDADILARAVRLTLTPGKASFLPGEHIPVRLALVNDNPEQVILYELRKAFLTFEAVDEKGRPATCQPSGEAPPRIRHDRFYAVRPRTQIDKSVWLDGYCTSLEPGTWRVTATYRIPPPYDGRAFGLDAVIGEFVGETTVEIARLAPEVNLSLRLTRPRTTRDGEPLPVELALTNRGPDGAWVRMPAQGGLDFEVQSVDGRSVDCTVETGRPPGPRDFVFLAAGAEHRLELDLAQRCRFPGPGAYRVRAFYEMVDGDARVLGARRARDAFTGTAVSQLLPLRREAAAPRATVSLEAREPSQVVRIGEPVLVSVRARNHGPDAAALFPPAKAWLAIELQDPQGRHVETVAPSEDPETGTLRMIRPGGATSAWVDLGPELAHLGPGRWRAVLTYVVPEGLSHRGLPAWSGRAQSRPLHFTLAGAGIPVRPPRVTPRPARPRLIAPPEVWLEAPRVYRAGGPVEIDLVVSGRDREGVVLAKPQPWMVALTVTDHAGRRERCRRLPAAAVAPRRTDFIDLAPGETHRLTLNLAEWCGIARADRYYVTAQLRVEAPWSGREHGLTAWTGTVMTEVLSMDVGR